MTPSVASFREAVTPVPPATETRLWRMMQKRFEATCQQQVSELGVVEPPENVHLGGLRIMCRQLGGFPIDFENGDNDFLSFWPSSHANQVI